MQVLINGATSGIAIAMLALAFQLVYLPTRLLFIGLGAVYSVTPYAYAYGIQAGLTPLLAAAAALSCAAILGLVLDTTVHAPLTRCGSSDASQMISSLGTYIVITQILAMAWGQTPRRFDSNSQSTFHFSGLALQESQLQMFLSCGSAICLLLCLLLFTPVGLRLRALADNPEEFARLGYSVTWFRGIAFALSGTLAGISALANANDIGYSPSSGLQALLPALVAVIIGGRGSFLGAMIGGVTVGMIRAEVVWHYSAQWQDAAVFAVLAIFLLFKPTGLTGRAVRLEGQHQ